MSCLKDYCCSADHWRFVLFRRVRVSLGLILFCTVAVSRISLTPSTAFADEGASKSRMQEVLENRVAQRPEDAGRWRLLGRFLLQQGEQAEAEAALRRALDIEPHHVAANFDMGEVLIAAERRAEAAVHFARVVELAPDSEYAGDAKERLSGLPKPVGDTAVIPAGYRIRTFDGAETVEELLPPEDGEPPREFSPWTIVVEAGAVYNSNVTLTPNARDFFAPEAAGAQGFINPDIEYRAFDNGLWRAGPTFVGYFGVNDGHLSDLNLQSYRPGGFLERSVFLDSGVLVPRIAYHYSLDQFAGKTFSNRHAITHGLTQYWDSGDLSVVHWIVDYTNFDPIVTLDPTEARDGWSHRLGGYHSWVRNWERLESVGIGGELQWVNAQGDDFAFRGIGVYADATVPITERLHLILEGGTGHRDYFRSQLVPPRDETLWRASSRLRLTWTPRLSTSAVFNYDRFHSRNELFDAQRYLTGLITTFVY